MHASVNMGCQGKSGPGKIHEVILVIQEKGFITAKIYQINKGDILTFCVFKLLI